MAKATRQETIRNAVPNPVYISVDKKIRTVSDSKRDFYHHYTRPINSVYRRVVEELLVEMHLLSVNVDFRYDPVYALGVVSSYQSFMQGYRPEEDKNAMFEALCKAVGGDPEQYRQDAQNLLIKAKEIPVDSLGEVEPFPDLQQASKFKYSRLFGIGLYTLSLESAPLLDQDQRQKSLAQLASTLNLPQEKLQKDLDLYRSNLQKIEQLIGVIEETLAADRKKRADQATPST